MAEMLDNITGEIVHEKFQRNFATPTTDWSEDGDPHTITEMAYVPPKAQIEDMMRAGKSLDMYRRARFGPELEKEISLEEEAEVFVTQNPGADLVDVQRAAEALSQRIVAQGVLAAEKAAKEAADAQQKAFQDLVAAAAAKLVKEKAVTP